MNCTRGTQMQNYRLLKDYVIGQSSTLILVQRLKRYVYITCLHFKAKDKHLTTCKLNSFLYS